MRPLSASEAIGPALERTRDVLARPFRFGTFLKIAAVAFFAQIGGGFSFNYPGRGGGLHGISPAVLAFLVTFAVLVGLISFVIGLVLLYLGSRLQLVLVELVATRQTYVTPLWRKYGPATWRWIGLKLLFFLCAALLCLPLAVPAVLFFIHQAHGAGGNPSYLLHIAQVVFFIAAAFVFILFIAAVYMLVRDLALPFLALEDRTISDSLNRLMALISAEPGQIVLYAFLRMLLGFVIGLGAEIAILMVLGLSLVPPAIVGLVLWLALHNAGAAGTAALIAIAVLAGIIFLCWAVCVVIGLIGASLIFGQAYALYFLGGRFPLLGDLLDRSTPPPSYDYAAAFPPYPPY